MSFTIKDAYHLSLISYFPRLSNAENICSMIEEILENKELCKQYENNELFRLNYELLKKVPREHYQDFYIKDIFDDNMQSGVVLYKIEHNDEIMVAIRGSEELDEENKTTGWQDWSDNFSMFLDKPTYQQLIALRYLNSLDSRESITICGHSKGGNLALFLLLACSKKYLSQIIHVYAFNAPGITNSVCKAYYKRIQSNEFQNKITLIENEHDCISEFFQHVKEPCIVKSNSPINNFIQAYHNHNLYTIEWNEENLIPATKKSVLPIMTNHFINGFFARLSKDRLIRINDRMNDYFNSELALNELYRVLIYHISCYTNLFDDIEFDEIKTITFHDLLQRRKTKNLLTRVKEDLPAYLNEQDIQQITNSVIENYNLILRGTNDKLQQIISNNNKKIKDKINSIQIRRN